MPFCKASKYWTQSGEEREMREVEGGTGEARGGTGEGREDRGGEGREGRERGQYFMYGSRIIK